MLNFITRDSSGFYSHKGIPENKKELVEDVAHFIEIENSLKDKKLSGQRIKNINNLLIGLRQVVDLAKSTNDQELLEEAENNLKEFEHDFTVLSKELTDLHDEYLTLLNKVISSSDRYITKIKKVLTKEKTKEVLALEDFLKRNGISLENVDTGEGERMKRFGVSL